MYITRENYLDGRGTRVAQQISNPLFRRKRRRRPLESTCPVFGKRSMERVLLAFRPFPSLFFSLNDVHNIRNKFVSYFSIYLYPFRSTHLKMCLRIFVKLVFTNHVRKVSTNFQTR